ncbi:melatonin receptor [Desmophyllum pertusum]|uniref:Melatonin receptor n=1 Tax=Desmophyllum pertusum TaxID=174260 RepID=A0A9W9ZWF7_9CNID|nr:melatonin receptor [Desmophyllum pertusum]
MASYLLFFFLLPLMATIISYTKVAKMIRQHNIGASSTIQRRERNTSISAHEIKVSKSLFAVVFAFMICWIPFWVIVVLRRFRVVEKMPRNFELLCMFLLYFSNTINPFIYAGMNHLFKREFRKILFCEKRRKVGVLSGVVRTEEVETRSAVLFRNNQQQDNYHTRSDTQQRSEDDQIEGHFNSFNS